MAPDHRQLDAAVFAAAQSLALQEQLPLAVVYLLEHWQPGVLSELKSLEQDLIARQIPLMVIVGEAVKSYAALQHHTRPVQTFKALSTGPKTDIKTHPYIWPGRVISIDELINLHAHDEIAC
jgi:hypothetical protein